MLTRRLPQSPALLHVFNLLGLTTAIALSSACIVNYDGTDDGAGDDTGSDGNTDGNDDSNTDGNTDSNTDSNSDGNTDSNTDGNDSSEEICDDACANLASCGVPIDECFSFCLGGACGECLANSDSCGQDCASACTPVGDGDGDPTGDGDGDPSGDGDGDGDPAKDCVINDDCGISFECVSCDLTDSEGWCEQSMECSFDTDCGFGGKCGYNVETGDWRCLPAEYCQ